MTNPLWVVRVRMFTTEANSPNAYRGLWGTSSLLQYLTPCADHSLDGLRTIVRDEGWRGLFKGTSLALVGVSNGAIQFMTYEKMKRWGFERKRSQFERAGKEWSPEVDKLVSAIVLNQNGLLLSQ